VITVNSPDDARLQEGGLGDLPPPDDVDGEVPVAFQIDEKPSDDEHIAVM